VENNQTDEPQEPDSDNKRGRDLFVGIILRAAFTLQMALPINEERFLGVSGSGFHDSRAYYLYGVLDEVLKLSTAMLRWEGFLSDPDKSEIEEVLKKEHGSHMMRVTREGLMDEQHLWSRKLVELLGDLLLFESTNTQEHYRLFLTCELLNAYLGLQRDFMDFFSCRNLNAEESIKLFCSTVKECSKSVDLKKVWFLNHSTNWDKPLKAGNLFCSTRARYKLALEQADANQKITLGVSYEKAYATPSRFIHANIGGPSLETSRNTSRTISSHVILLCTQIILQAHKLAGVPLTGDAEFVHNLVKTKADATEALNSVSGKELDVGDIVFAYGEDLCIVTEKSKSAYGYTSYRVKYLTTPPLHEVPEDWYPARYVHLVCPHKKIREELIQIFETHLPSHAKKIRTLPDKDLLSLLAQSALQLYKEGVFHRLRMKSKPPSESPGAES